MDFLNYVAETSKAWDEPRPRENEGFRHSSYQGESIHTLSEDTLMREKLTILTRRLDEMEMNHQHSMHPVNELSASQPSCYNYQSNGHYGEHCQKNIQILNQGRPPMNTACANSYIQNWKNYSNIPGKSKLPAYIPPTDRQQLAPTSQQQQLPPLSPVEQAILNLSKVVGNFVEEQKGINVQLAQRIDTVENTLNKRIDGLESNLNQKIDNLKYSITKFNKLLEGQERGRFPSQTLPNPKGIHEVGSSNNSGMDEVKAIITLRSGKEVDQPMPKPVEDSRQGEKNAI